MKSWRDPDKDPYHVDLNAATCDCPHFQGRLKGTGEECKHLRQAREEAKRMSIARAFSLPLEELRRQAQRSDLRPEIRDAIRIALGCKPGHYARV